MPENKKLRELKRVTEEGREVILDADRVANRAIDAIERISLLTRRALAAGFGGGLSSLVALGVVIYGGENIPEKYRDPIILVTALTGASAGALMAKEDMDDKLARLERRIDRMDDGAAKQNLEKYHAKILLIESTTTMKKEKLISSAEIKELLLSPASEKKFSPKEEETAPQPIRDSEQ